MNLYENLDFFVQFFELEAKFDSELDCGAVCEFDFELEGIVSHSYPFPPRQITPITVSFSPPPLTRQIVFK